MPHENTVLNSTRKVNITHTSDPLALEHATVWKISREHGILTLQSLGRALRSGGGEARRVQVTVSEFRLMIIEVGRLLPLCSVVVRCKYGDWVSPVSAGAGQGACRHAV